MSADHANPIDVADVTDAERARMLLDYLDTFRAEFGIVPRLMPLDAETKAPWITGRASLDEALPSGEELPSEAAEAVMIDGFEAARQIADEGAVGFALYAGRQEFGTYHAAFSDHDDPETFPAPTGDAEPTLEVLSGSGRGTHETFRNDGDDRVRNARLPDEAGEIRAENWYVVTPGSVHPSGGVYHVVADREIATLADADLTDDMRSNAKRREGRDPRRNSPARDVDGVGDRPDDESVRERLEAAFERSPTGDKYRAIYDGRYASAGYSDRSAAEFALANWIDMWVGFGDQAVVESVLDAGNLRKWAERTDAAYRDSVLANVGYQDWYADERSDGDSEGETGDVEPVSVLPLAQLGALAPDERRRAARKRGLEWPTTDDLRERLRERIHDNVRDGEDVVIPAPTSSGKSFSVSTERWRDLADVTDGSPVIHLHETCKARDNALEDTREHGGEGAAIYGRREACPVARGDHDPDADGGDGGFQEQGITIDGRAASAWLDEQCDEKGVPFSAAHAYLDEHNDQRAPLPCCPPVDDSDDDGRQVCPAVSQWQNVPRDDEGEPTYDVVHATHPFAHVPGLVRESTVVVDEQPDFTVELGETPDEQQNRTRRAIAAYLREINAPVSTFETFVSLARLGDGAWRTDAGREADALADAIASRSPSREWYLTDPDAHTLAPAIARAIWYALRDEDSPDANGRRSATVPHEPPRLDAGAHDEAGWNREWVSVVVDKDNDVRRVRAAPDLSLARCVIGLDAHPTPSLWQLNTRPNIQVDPLLDTDERRLWRRFERGLTVVQVGDDTRPAGKKGKYAKRDRGREPFVRHLREHFGDEFATAITDSHSEGQLRSLLEAAGVSDERLGTMHFGEERSRNDFAGESIGAVLGCIDAGDEYVLDALAELGLDAAPETDVDDEGEQFRAYGRGFDGPDADTASALVASVRETHVAQAAGRYARNADDPDDTATVFCRTNASPPGFADYQVAGVEHVAGEKQRAVAEAAREHPGATARELRERASDRLGGDETVSKSHVSKTLAAFLGRGVIQRQRGAGAFGGDEWHERGDGLTDAAVAGDVDLDGLADRVLSLWGTLEHQYVIHDLGASTTSPSSAGGWGSLAPEPVDGGDSTLHDG